MPKAPELIGYQAVVAIDDPGALRHGWTWTPRGIYANGRPLGAFW